MDTTDPPAEGHDPAEDGAQQGSHEPIGPGPAGVAAAHEGPGGAAGGGPAWAGNDEPWADEAWDEEPSADEGGDGEPSAEQEGAGAPVDEEARGRRRAAWLAAAAAVATAIIVALALTIGKPHALRLVQPPPTTAGGLTLDRQLESSSGFKSAAAAVRQRLLASTYGSITSAVVAVYDVPGSTSLAIGGPIRVIYIGGMGVIDQQMVISDGRRELGASAVAVPTDSGAAECGQIGAVSLCTWATRNTVGIIYSPAADESPAQLAGLLRKMRADLEK